MKKLIVLLMLVIGLVFLTGCGNNSSDNNEGYTIEVNGPGGNFAGATQFTPEMLAGQIIYTFDEKNSIWRGVTFTPQGKLRYESMFGIEDDVDYSVLDGKLVVADNDMNPIIELDVAEPTKWEVTGMDDDGRVWQDTWYLELKFTSEMLVGKRYLSTYSYLGESIEEEVFFTQTTLKVYATDGTLKHSYPYRLENNTIVVAGDDGEYTLNLMFVDEENRFGIWYVSEVENYANYSMWTPMGDE
ncbi:hypothetical protein [Sulfurovum sp. NBC37-1]|uniref:hypothetical protein n=1 Tax=Sulfurovum sp. (strain NBC37-1) TaxID=387093 RepID=UPI00015875AE|nr:hypothetical protein [Sulfurovum sp. NBC37-1]BAF71827.1 hypothetical protein SUN_0869 [Sulfurovum sp. NBC37-1]